MNNISLPEWYNNTQKIDNISKYKRSRTLGRAARKALSSLAQMLANELAQPVQPHFAIGRVDVRIKIVVSFALIVLTTLVQSLTNITALLILAILICFAMEIPFKKLMKFWLGVPLFTMALAIPAIFNVITPGDAAFTICHLGKSYSFGPYYIPESITVTHSGLIVASRLLLRSTACVTYAFALIGSTQHSVLINGLRKMGMPKVFGMTLVMMQRYLTVLIRIAEEIHLAKISRTISSESARKEQQWVAAGIGSLFRRTHKLTEEVHNAMVSRGFDGDLKVRK